MDSLFKKKQIFEYLWKSVSAKLEEKLWILTTLPGKQQHFYFRKL